MSEYNYNQYNKDIIRHKIIRSAVEKITLHREKSACVARDYVRNIWEYFILNNDFSKSKEEATRMDKTYITNWESLHDSYIGKKDVRDLLVCYLCGPEPNNDFQQFMDLGVLPQNIWAFELDGNTYDRAVSTYAPGEFPQPKILKQNIDTFFRNTPKKFDIVYIDACGSIPSSQHALKTITTLCSYSRLNSPGVVISNFSSLDISTEIDKWNEMIQLISIYEYFKRHSEDDYHIGQEITEIEEFKMIEEKVKKEWSIFYGDFISSLLRDIPSVIVPIQRITDNAYLNRFITIDKEFEYPDLMQKAKGNSLARFFFYLAFKNSRNEVSTSVKTLIGEIGDFKKLIKGFEWIVALRSGRGISADIKEIYEYFENNKEIYQFLDKPHSNFVFDAVINQLIYPMHYNPDINERYSYIAKTRRMYTDVSVYDECRYIYEWLPALHQIKSAFGNISWQYVFRFSMDGLIRTRMNYDNEFFYQGAVVSHEEGDFKKSIIPERMDIEDTLGGA